MSRDVLLILGLHLSALVACQPSEPSRTEFTVRDSAGVRIASSRGPIGHTVSGWLVSDEPTLRIESDPVDPDLVLHWIRGVVRLSDGRIALISESANELRFHASDGTHLSTVGGEGDGPGKLRSPYWLLRLPGDTLVVTDRATGLSTGFGPQGDYLWRRGWDRQSLQGFAPEGYSVSLVQPVSVDWGIALIYQLGIPPPGRLRQRRGYVLVSGAVQPPTFLGWYLSIEHFYLSEAFPQIALFPRETYLATGGPEERIYIGDSAEYEILVFGKAGALELIIRDEEPPDLISDQDLEWERWAFLSWGETIGMLGDFERIADATPLPDRKPAFEQLVVDSEGCLWVKEYASHRPHPMPWRIYGPEGQRIGSVRLPGRMTVYDIGVDYILGVVRDLNDVESVLAFRFTRPEQ